MQCFLLGMAVDEVSGLTKQYKQCYIRVRVKIRTSTWQPSSGKPSRLQLRLQHTVTASEHGETGTIR